MEISRDRARLTLWQWHLLILLLMIGPLLGCVRNPIAGDDAEKTQYHPLPRVEISMFAAGDRIVSAYVRHSRGAVLFHLSFDKPDYPCTASLCRRDSDVTLSSSHIKFCSTRYENFDQSFDMFEDGRIILVPLPEADGKAVGVFVNLVSGKRYFLAPSVKSHESLAKIRWLAGTRHHVTVIVPEHWKARDYLAQFPEFQR